MAVVTRKSTAITNRDATPTVQVNASVSGGSLKAYEGWVTATNGDSATSVYPMFSVPSNSRVSSLHAQNEALGASCTVNVGVYAPTSSPQTLKALGFGDGAAINATFFASALAVTAAAGQTDILNQSTLNTIDKQEMELWQALGLASDPGCNLDISFAVQVAVAATGKLGLKAVVAN